MEAIARVLRAVNAFNTVVGRLAAWLTLGVVLVTFGVVVLRYAFSIGYVWMQDLYVWLHAVVFTSIAGYTFLRDGHVRVDVFYRPASLRYKAWADLLGTLVFLWPFLAVVVLWGWGYIGLSWRLMESSPNTGGLPGMYVVKSFVVFFCVVVGLQGLAVAARSILILAGRDDLVPADYRYGGT